MQLAVIELDPMKLAKVAMVAWPSISQRNSITTAPIQRHTSILRSPHRPQPRRRSQVADDGAQAMMVT